MSLGGLARQHVLGDDIETLCPGGEMGEIVENLITPNPID